VGGICGPGCAILLPVCRIFALEKSPLLPGRNGAPGTRAIGEQRVSPLRITFRFAERNAPVEMTVNLLCLERDTDAGLLIGENFADLGGGDSGGLQRFH